MLVANADGRLEVFVVRNDLTVWHRWQDMDGHWSDWHSLKRPGEGTPGPLAVATHFDGSLHLFTNDPHGAIWHCWQTRPGWSPWTSLGTPGSHRARSGPVPVNRQNSDPELFVVAEDGTLRHCWQIRYNDKEFGWSGWESLGSQGSGLAEIAVAANADRRLVVFATEPENGNDLWQREEISPEGGWAPWLSRASSLRLDRTETGPLRGPRLILEPTHQLLRLFLQVSSLNYPGEGGIYDMRQPNSPTENWSGGIFSL